MAKTTRRPRLYRGGGSDINLTKGSRRGAKAEVGPEIRTGGTLRSDSTHARWRAAKNEARKLAAERAIAAVKRHRNERLDRLKREHDSGAIGEAEYRSLRVKVFKRANDEIAKIKANPPGAGTTDAEVAETRAKIEAMRAKKADKRRKKLENKIRIANERLERGEIDLAERDRIVEEARAKHRELR